MAARNPCDNYSRLIDRFVLDRVHGFLRVHIALHLFGREIDKENIVSEKLARKFNHDFIGPDARLAKIALKVIPGLFLMRQLFLEFCIALFGKLFLEGVAPKRRSDCHLILFILVDVIIAIRHVADAVKETRAFSDDTDSSPSTGSEELLRPFLLNFLDIASRSGSSIGEASECHFV